MSKTLIKDLESKIEALVIAIPREQDAFDFYTELAEEYEDTSSKEMFAYLAKQEMQHKKNLENILRRLEVQLEEAKKNK